MIPACQNPVEAPPPEPDYNELIEPVGYDFGLSRRSFVQILGAGLMITAGATSALAQRMGGRGGGLGGRGAQSIGARVHLGKDGSITVLVGKVEAGQGARAELTQAAAEELHVPVDRLTMIMADTMLGPDDGITAGSGTSPRTVPAVRQGCAAARQLLIAYASRKLDLPPDQCNVQDGKVMAGKDPVSYADLAASEDISSLLSQPVPQEVTVTAVKDWKVLGVPTPRPNRRDIVTGSHKYPSDIVRPGMLYGKVLRPPSYGAKLTAVDLGVAKEMKGVITVQDDQFVGVAAPSAFAAAKAIEVIAKTAQWETRPQISSKELYSYLRSHAEGGVPESPFIDEISQAKIAPHATYHVPYVQHAPLEPRAAVAEWQDGKLTVWTGTQNPYGCRAELARAFHLADNRVRVIVPDFGAGFGGKHTGETGVEAARLAKAADKPVSLRWTREEEFTWAYFRPAAVIEAAATLDAQGKMTSWHFINVNSGQAGLETPYRVASRRSRYIPSNPPLRHGSYRALAATANHFARESFMDELAAAAGCDPYQFRLTHLDNARLRAVLKAAVAEFHWEEQVKEKRRGIGVGLACGTEKGSFVAACVEVEIDTKQAIRVKRVCQAFECGAILNPDNLLKQVKGAIIMGLGPALREEMRFDNGQMLTTSFRACQVPRFDDVPELDVHLIDRPDLASAGAGETPIIAIAPAIANAVFHATGQRVRSMPIRLV